MDIREVTINPGLRKLSKWRCPLYDSASRIMPFCQARHCLNFLFGIDGVFIDRRV